MPRIYDAQLAKCPFFISSGKKNVVCEGITNTCTLNMLFVTEETRNLHRKIYCDTNYEKCELYRMLVEKYED